ncbi:hypothetical protein C6496_05655 [Candidatus Poribacteria bacterium]|nr:MAG: hypothetical protein C6496_05655 [Candidatus Poribacteria bacterium]
MKRVRTEVLKIEAQPTYHEINAQSAEVWNECIYQGDLTGIRKDLNVGKRGNQKLHQWAFGKITTLITYKAKELGIKVVKIDESYTSQTCPKCGNRKKPVDRNYVCKCGFRYHRDGVGAINIRRKYQGLLGQPVVAAMAPPSYIRYSDIPVALA